MEQKLFQITEFSKIARTSRKTLQYYDELDLFRPALVGENGYRYYALSQLDRLALIAALRDMGLSLREIKSYLQQEDGENLNALLEAQLDRAEEMMERLRCRKALLTEMLAENRLLQSLCGQGYQLRRWEAQRAVKLTDLDRSIASTPACAYRSGASPSSIRSGRTGTSPSRAGPVCACAIWWRRHPRSGTWSRRPGCGSTPPGRGFP